MKHKNLLTLALSALLLASCGAQGNSNTPSASTPDSTGDNSSASSSRTRTSHTSADGSDQTPTSSRPGEASLPDTLPAIQGTEIAYVEGLRSGGESDAAANAGYLYEWHGDGGSVVNFAYADGEYSFNYTPGWAWYGVQLFYRLPYSQAGDTYAVRLRLYSDVAGQITLNGAIKDLVWGWNVLTFETGLQESGVVLSVQIGVNDNQEAGIVASALQGSFIKMKDIEVYDAVNTYHKVEFKVGEETKKSIQVRDGKLVSAPRIDVPEGKVLEGWFDGDDAFDPSAPVTAAKTYVAKIVDASAVETFAVSYSLNGEVIATQNIVKNTAAQFGDVEAPFGYAIDGFYTDSAMQTAYTTQPIAADTTIYVKAHVAPTTYYHNGQVAREERRGDNGEFITEYHNNGFDASWNIQVNFAPLPIGEVGKTYSFSCEYTLVGTETAGSYQIYDNASISPGELPVTSSFRKITATFDGGILTDGNKFTMELGFCKPAAGDEGTVIFTVRNPKLVEVI